MRQRNEAFIVPQSWHQLYVYVEDHGAYDEVIPGVVAMRAIYLATRQNGTKPRK